MGPDSGREISQNPVQKLLTRLGIGKEYLNEPSLDKADYLKDARDEARESSLDDRARGFRQEARERNPDSVEPTSMYEGQRVNKSDM